MIKIDEYKRKLRKQKANKLCKLKVELPEEVFWKGVNYYDICKAEKELKEIADK